jgi:NADPH:quinone reductase
MVQARVVQLTEFGAPEVMRLVDAKLASPASGEVLVRQTAVGFNFIDVYQRRGIYPLPSPTGLGHEGIGVIEALGLDVKDLAIGQRVGTINAGLGAYASHRIVPAEKLIPIPTSIDDEQAAALLFKGMTAQYLVQLTHNVQAGDLLLVHSAAGGVGQIVAGWANSLGAEVYGTASSSEKCRIAEAAGCRKAVNYLEPDWVEQFLAATGGRKARVVYDAVGKDTFLKSLDCIAPFGLMVLYGAASGPVAPIEPELLNKKGCLFLTRPSIFPHNATVATMRTNAASLFAAHAEGRVRVEIGSRFALSDIVAAHHHAESRRGSGTIVILPQG